MKTIALAVLLAAVSFSAVGQNPATASPTANRPSSAVAADLDRLRAAASQANLEIAHMRIEKWKADANSRQQAQGNADSLQRNLTSALPGLIDNFRAAPQDLSAGFKLYRNLNALYDVLASFTESAGAFGPKSDYEALAQQLMVIDSVRRDLGDNLETLSTSTQSELNQLRTQVRTLQQTAAAAPPKKVVVDDTQSSKKSTRKKKPATASGASSSSSGASTPAATKSQ